MSQKTISRDTIDQLRAQFIASKPKIKTELTLREAVAEMQVEIRHMITELGYSFEDVARFFLDAGARASASTLQAYMAELTPRKSTKKEAKVGKTERVDVSSEQRRAAIQSTVPHRNLVQQEHDASPTITADVAGNSSSPRSPV